MIELMKAGLAMGWPALGLLVALLFYFKFSISDPAANKRAVFKTFIGILACRFSLYGDRQLQDEFLCRVPAVASVPGPDHIDGLHDGVVFHQYQRTC